jgi:hypothetical protein
MMTPIPQIAAKLPTASPSRTALAFNVASITAPFFNVDVGNAGNAHLVQTSVQTSV